MPRGQPDALARWKHGYEMIPGQPIEHSFVQAAKNRGSRPAASATNAIDAALQPTAAPEALRASDYHPAHDASTPLNMRTGQRANRS